MPKKTTPTPRSIEYRLLDDLKANPANPKDHAVEMIEASVDRFGYIDGAVIDARTGYIISGHGRTKTLRAIRDRGDAPPDGIRVDDQGRWLVPVQVGWASRNDAEAAAALVGLNRTTELGGWVDDSLLDILEQLSTDEDHGLEGVGFGTEDLDSLRERLEKIEPPDQTPPGNVTEPPVKDLPNVPDLVTLHHGDCLDVMRTMPDSSVDAIVTDPPYGLGFMGKAWDDLPPGEDWARECLRVLKPGGHLLAFGGSRTWHRLAVAVEDAGLEIRDSIAWLYGSGFPKSLNVAKAIATGGGRPEDIRRAAMGDDYEPSGRGRVNYDHGSGSAMNGTSTSVPMTEDAECWQGWGTALKPAFEPIVVGRKPLEGTVAENVLTHGTGALNIDGCRISADDALVRPAVVRDDNEVYGKGLGSGVQAEPAGRWPANVVLDDSQAAELDAQSGELVGRNPGVIRRGAKSGTSIGGRDVYGTAAPYEAFVGYGDSGGASRFFPTFRYEAKAATSERPRVGDVAHPTVKPVELMQWLVRLVTPPGGVVLEPFAGSGTTLEACVLEGFACIGIEREDPYVDLICQRLGVTRDSITIPGHEPAPSEQ